jgi:A/G-specific adenine glycosylase
MNACDSIKSNQITFFRKQLLTWFDQYGRHSLPWQIKKTPYKVWLSEVMLQQTQVNTVIPYFQKFLERFPKVTSLANANLDDVLSLWAGLGYYRRARYLHQCAQSVVSDFNGEFPTSLEQLITLPGIGRSTAGAIMSLSMNKKAAILDGNVKRVLSRFLAIEEPLNESSGMKHLWCIAEALTPNERFDAYNQAMMDLGATCCTRSKPLCEHCPLSKKCQAYASGQPTDYPIRAIKKKAKPTRKTQMLVLVNSKNEIFLEKRNQSGIWPGLFSLPELLIDSDIATMCKDQWSLDVQEVQKIDTFTHQFTHFSLTIQPSLCYVKIGKANVLRDSILDTFSWHTFQEALNLGIPAPVKKIIQSLLQAKLLKKG